VERIPWVHTHFTALILILIGAIWLVFIARYYWRKHRGLQAAFQEEKIKRKYLSR